MELSATEAPEPPVTIESIKLITPQSTATPEPKKILKSLPKKTQQVEEMPLEVSSSRKPVEIEEQKKPEAPVSEKMTFMMFTRCTRGTVLL